MDRNFDLKSLKTSSKSLTDLAAMINESGIKFSDSLLSRLIKSKNPKYNLNRWTRSRQVCLKSNVFDCDSILERFPTKLMGRFIYGDSIQFKTEKHDFSEKTKNFTLPKPLAQNPKVKEVLG